MICQLCLAGGSGMGCVCEDCEDRYNAAIFRVAELEAAITLIGKFNKEGANDLRIASQVTFALMTD